MTIQRDLKDSGLYAGSTDPAGTDLSGTAAAKRIMLVIPGRIFRHGIELVLQGAGGGVVHNCETLEEAETVFHESGEPHLDLVVVGMDDPARATEDFARMRAMRERMPTTRWIVLGNCGGPDFWWQAVESRVDGLLHHDSLPEVLQLLVRLILLGYSFLPSSAQMEQARPSLAMQPLDIPPIAAASAIGAMFPVPKSQAAAEGGPGRPWSAGLSQRESDILRCLVAGQSNKLIARELGISEATVKVHVKALLRKMQVTNRTQAAISALKFLDRPVPPTAPSPFANDIDPSNDGS